jgi:hypothetical protein
MGLVKDDTLDESKPGTAPDVQQAAPTPSGLLRATLADLLEDWVLWTPAVFCLSGFDRDPASEFARFSNARLGCMPKLPRPLFADSLLRQQVPFLDKEVETTWANTLWLCERLRWPELGRFLKSLGGVDFANQGMGLAMLQNVKIYDVLALEKGANLPPEPSIEIKHVGIEASFGTIGFVAATVPGQQPHLFHQPPGTSLLPVAGQLLACLPGWARSLSQYRDPSAYRFDQGAS